MLCPLSYVEWGDRWVLPPTRPGHSRASILMVNHRECHRSGIVDGLGVEPEHTFLIREGRTTGAHRHRPARCKPTRTRLT